MSATPALPGPPLRLRCELLENPLGLTRHPQFSWVVNDARPAELQTAYEIIVASTPERLTPDKADL